MDFSQARNRIIALMKEGDKSYGKVTMNEYKQLYYSVLSHLNNGNDEWRTALGLFLINGALTFDRFVGQRPKSVDKERFDMFCRFLATLQKIDGRHLERTAFLHLEETQWKLYSECSLLPCDEQMQDFLMQCENDVRQIKIAGENQEVINNIEKKKEEILGLISNIREGKIRTKIHTTLPYKLTNTDTTIHLVLYGVSVDVSLRYHSQGCTLPMTNIAEGATMTTSGPSKWITTTCELDIEAHCLIDALEKRSMVTLRKEEDERYWTTIFDFTYRVVTAIWRYFQQNEEVTGAWPPLPNDMHYIGYSISAENKVYDHEFSTNPSLVYHVTSLKKSSSHYDIGEVEAPKWSEYTFLLAKNYAETGQFDEAIFWVNVSAEALVEEFIQKIATSDEMLFEIEKDELKFNTAEEILVEQFPEMKGKVNWPDTVIHASTFAKLKRAVKLSSMAPNQKEILKKYSQVNAKRNILFHGGDADICVTDVEKAFGAYNWLRERL